MGSDKPLTIYWALGGAKTTHGMQPCTGGRDADNQASFPTETDAPEHDAEFTAEKNVKHRKNLVAMRKRLGALIKELFLRFAPLTEMLRYQQPSHASTLPGVHLGDILILTLVMEWPDWQSARHHTVDSGIIDTMNRSGALVGT